MVVVLVIIIVKCWYEDNYNFIYQSGIVITFKLVLLLVSFSLMLLLLLLVPHYYNNNNKNNNKENSNNKYYYYYYYYYHHHYHYHYSRALVVLYIRPSNQPTSGDVPFSQAVRALHFSRVVLLLRSHFPISLPGFLKCGRYNGGSGGISGITMR